MKNTTPNVTSRAEANDAAHPLQSHPERPPMTNPHPSPSKSIGAVLADLQARVEAATGPDRELDGAIEVAIRWLEAGRVGLKPEHRAPWKSDKFGSVFDVSVSYAAQPFTRSIDAAIALVGRVLPGWWWKVGTCSVSDDACIAPDYNSPVHGERLRRELDLDKIGGSGSEFDWGFDVDRRPPGNVPLALIEALLRAKIAIEGLSHD